MFAFRHYQAKNRLILFDAIGTLAEVVGDSLNRKEYINVLMPPLIACWNVIKDDERKIFPLLECLTYIAQALGVGFIPYASKVYARCLRIIETKLREYNVAVCAYLFLSFSHFSHTHTRTYTCTYIHTFPHTHTLVFPCFPFLLPSTHTPTHTYTHCCWLFVLYNNGTLLR